MSDQQETPDNLILLPFGASESVPVPVAPSAPAEFSDGEVNPPAPGELISAVEAVLFAAREPLSATDLCSILGIAERGLVMGAIRALITSMERRGAGIALVEVGGGWQLRTSTRYTTWTSRVTEVKPVRLSAAATETLSIIAYRQPTTCQDIESLRGVDCGGMVRKLIQRGLVRSVGKAEQPGRPLLYGTTPFFLEFMGLRDLSDLPALRDLHELEEDDSPEFGPLFD